MEARALESERRLALARGDEALKHAIAAAELYMQAARKATTNPDRVRLNRKCSDLIALGERLKANAAAAAATSRVPVPESTRLLPAAEKAILLRSSRLHGNIFPPWEKAPDPSSFSDADADGGAYIDPTSYSLSADQQAIFAGWRRPAEIAAETQGRASTGDAASFISGGSEIDLAQDLATDCSVVASLCAAVRHFGRKKGSLLPSLMYPYNHEAMQPAVSENGKYVFRMNFNGCWRQVVIDDRLPVSSTTRTLYVVDRRNPRLAWPALIEKAYLKIRGGYDFPGSNSGTDLHALTGWIPEQIFLQSDDIELDEMWNRIKPAYDQGNVILTLGTGKMLPEEEAALGLVKEHDYAVLDLKMDSLNRLFLVKNPWYDSLVWTGVGSSAILDARARGPSSESRTNMFWMTFEDVIQHFDSLYVNWNPALFKYRQDHHFTWEVPGKTEELVFTHNPQYSVLPSSGRPVWVLLSRHWQDGELDILRERKADKDRHDSSLANMSKQLGFVSLALFGTTPPGTRVPLADGYRCLHQGPYVDSPNTLLRFEPTPGLAQTLVVAQSELPLPKYSFTLSFFSDTPLTASPASEVLEHQTTVSGAWTWRTAGGSAAHASYLSNPQFAITLPQATRLSLVLSTDVPDLPVHVAVLFSGGGQRVTAVAGRDLLGSSAEYQRGCTSASVARIDAGTYTVVASTFEPGQTGKFSLRVCADVPVALKPVLADAAGRLRTPAPTLAVFDDGQQRLRARVNVTRLTRAGILARSSNPSASSVAPAAPSAIRVALELGTGPHRRVLVVSGDGEFADASLGLRTSDVDVDPETARARGGLWLVVEQIGGTTASSSNSSTIAGSSGQRSKKGAQIEVLSDSPVHLGAWEHVEEEDDY
ncbi:calpain-like protease palB/rim-13 [Lasiosphaeria miniovina]|uniref:Calpain-like protease palB/rim-13 n=1 Tax=Lasiosphaeria miniovina TaxID=1954250 RepID=A0AA40AVL0_9PEZI|nr:calpain-like protease palB/rim-13 [Lasiosphaeria miniovina]KAK0722833.1 calpain-like protease palB/rim-13 [Lasiosphaeria miniovina]